MEKILGSAFEIWEAKMRKVARQCTMFHDAPKMFWINEKDNKPFKRFICEDCKKKGSAFEIIGAKNGCRNKIRKIL